MNPLERGAHGEPLVGAVGQRMPGLRVDGENTHASSNMPFGLDEFFRAPLPGGPLAGPCGSLGAASHSGARRALADCRKVALRRGLVLRELVKRISPFAVVVCALLALGGAFALAPLWRSLLLAAWFAALTRPMAARLASRLGGKSRAAAILLVSLGFVVTIPLAVIAASLVGSAMELTATVARSPSARSALEALVDAEGQGPAPFDQADLSTLLNLAKEHGARAAALLQTVLGATARGAIGLFVFALGSYAILTEGHEAYEWLILRLPVRPEHARRLVAAFVETGRGLFVGIGLTALVQGGLATLAYLVLGVPRALVLGLLTTIAALIPSFGTGLVWLPVAIALGLTGRTGAAIAMGVFGVVVISSVDNVLRPMLARYGKLALSPFLVFASIFGGLALFGGFGLLVGPLAVRLGKEALEILAGEPPEPEDPTDEVE